MTMQTTLFSLFQFTRPRGARPARVRRRDQRQRVSIHAPTRGATPGVWQTAGAVAGFNSRAHEGRDRRDCERGRAGRVSIHAPTRGATPPSSLAASGKSFQFTRPRGARREAAEAHPQAPRFNSRAHEGRDPKRVCDFAGLFVSIHAPTRGATRRPCATSV